MAASDERINQLFLDAADIAPEDQETFLQSHCPDSSEMVAEVMALLQAAQEAKDGALEEAPWSRVVQTMLGPAGDCIGKQLGVYRIDEEIGRGGMGCVYRGWDTRLHRPVAIKVLSGATSFTPQAIERFEREMAAIGQVSHPHIVSALYADVIDGCHFLVMEYVDGENLQSLVHRAGPQSPEESCRLIRQAALGLQHFHEHGILHRDVKPANLLLADDGTVRVLDLGLALLRFGSDSQPLTQAGMIMGTPDYMAPEQLDGRSTDARTDIYGLGCTFYCLLAGAPPFQHLSQQAPKMMAQCWDAPPPIPEIAGTILDQLLQRMLAKDPDDRPASMADCIQDIDTAMSLPVESVASPRPIVKPFLSRAMGICFSILLLSGLFLAAWAVWLSRPSAGSVPASAEQELLQHLRDAKEHLHQLPVEARPAQRFLWLPRWYAIPHQTGKAKIALEKVFTALVRRDVSMQPVGDSGRLYVIDLKKLHWWVSAQWQHLLSLDPYALDRSHQSPWSLAMQQVAEQTEVTIPFIRADWFVEAVVTDPQLQRELSPTGAGAVQFPTDPEIELLLSWYRQDLSGAMVASELGMRHEHHLINKLKGLPQQSEWSHGTVTQLINRKRITRKDWSNVSNRFSVFQRLAEQLDLGQPFRVLVLR